MTTRGWALGGGNGVGGVVEGYGESVRRAGCCRPGTGRPCNVARAFSARVRRQNQLLNMTGAKKTTAVE